MPFGITGIHVKTNRNTKIPFYRNIDISNTVNYILYNDLTARGWNTTDAISVQLTNNGVVGSINPSLYALYINSNFPVGSFISIINNGQIVGAAGRGGDSGNGIHNGIMYTPAQRGGNGGPALYIGFQSRVCNINGVIGGGGGGGGGTYAFSGGRYARFGGGGGGQGYYGGEGGIGYSWDGYQKPPAVPTAPEFRNGTAGSISGPGTGAATSAGDYGGTGGKLGSVGGFGLAYNFDLTNKFLNMGNGGSAGAAIVGIGNITFITTTGNTTSNRGRLSGALV